MWSRTGVARFRSPQQGAVVVYAAFFLGVLIAATTLAIDMGRLYNAQRDLQRAANLAALDAAAVSGGCYGNFGGDLQDDPLQLAQTEAAESLSRNGVPGGYLSGTGAVQIGKLSSESGVRVFRELQAGEDVNARTAVQVTLTRPTPDRILPLTSGSVMTARAAADSRPRVTIGVASSVANVNLLNGIFGNFGGVGLTLVGYQGLLTTNVRLGTLAANLGVGSVDDLLSSDTSLPLDDVLNALGQGQTGTVATLLSDLASQANGAPNVVLGDVIDAPLGLGESGADAVVNAGQLLTALAQASNGTNLVNLPLSLNLGPTLTATAQVRLIEPQKIAIIRAGVTPLSGAPVAGEDSYASTAQAVVQINVSSTTALYKLTLPLYLQLAKSTASLDEVRCARHGQDRHEVDLVGQATLAAVGLGEFDNLSAPNPQPKTSKVVIAQILGTTGPGGALITLQTSPIQAAVQSEEQTIEFDGPFPSDMQGIGTPVGAGVAGALSSLGAANLEICVGPCGSAVSFLINLVVAPIKATVGGILSSVVASLDTALVPLLDTLGISAGNGLFQVVSLDPVNSTEINPDADQQLSLQAFLFNH